MLMIQLEKEHFFFAVWTLQRVIPHSKKKTVAPGVEAENCFVFGFMDCFVQLVINLPVPSIKAIVACHLEIFFRDMLDEQFDKINGGKGFFNKRIVFVPVIVESHRTAVIGINPGKCDNRAPKVAADIFDNGIRVAKVRLCVNIKAIYVLAVYLRFCFFERRTNTVFQFI